MAQICVPICESTFDAMKETALRADRFADLIELRLDGLTAMELKQIGGKLEQLSSTLVRPVIMTLRPIEQGGGASLNLSERAEFFTRMQSAAMFDIELDLATKLMSNGGDVEWSKIICSHHDFHRVPDDLDRIYERIAATPARILKVAVHANDIVDCVPVFNLLERAQTEGREMIGIAMGMPGLPTRILGPAFGGYLTYGSIDDGRQTASGQPTATHLSELYRIGSINSQTRVTGLVGLPVSHSISPHIHNAAFASCGVNAVFIPLEVHDLRAFFRRMVNPATREIPWNLQGLSVTAPHKSAVIDMLDSVDAAAREIGAVNTVVIEGNKLLGYNTDASGFLRALKDKFGSLKGANCAIIGAGGASRAALWGLRSEGASTTLFARDLNKASAVANSFASEVKPLKNARFDGFDVVVNATPLGTHGALSGETAAVAEQLAGTRLAYDMVYNPSETLFLREARLAGCETLGGMTMLVNQAVEQFRLWTGIDAPFEVMKQAATTALMNG